MSAPVPLPPQVREASLQAALPSHLQFPESHLQAVQSVLHHVLPAAPGYPVLQASQEAQLHLTPDPFPGRPLRTPHAAIHPLTAAPLTAAQHLHQAPAAHHTAHPETYPEAAAPAARHQAILHPEAQAAATLHQGVPAAATLLQGAPAAASHQVPAIPPEATAVVVAVCHEAVAADASMLSFSLLNLYRLTS